ncbi:MAG: thrombospondin type 3 repeat-containing protein [Myxococcales bacterium]
MRSILGLSLALVALPTAGCGRLGLKLLDLPVQVADGGQDAATPGSLPGSDAGALPDDMLGGDGDAGPAANPGTGGGGDAGPIANPGSDAAVGCSDMDGDGLCDSADNCLALANVDQKDFDGDGFGDVCDDDDDGDGSADDVDACPLDPLRAVADACGCNVTPPPVRAAHWMLDETSGNVASEATGQAPNGTLTNVTGTPWTQGHVDGALSFDGVDDYVQVGAAGSAIKGLSFWAKPSSGTAITNLTPAVFPSSYGPNNDWSSPQNAYADGGGSATANLTLLGSKNEHWGGFHLDSAIPQGVSILGVTVIIKSSTFGVIQGLGVELSWDGGSSHTSAGYGGTAIVGSNNLSTYGGVAQLWGRSWQRSDFSDANFRVRVRLSGLLGLAASVDYLTVQIKYSDYQNPRNILNLNASAKVEFVDTQLGMAASNWPGAITYVNGVPGATLGSDWNHVVVTSAQAIDVSQLQLGNVTSESPSFPFHGLLDDVVLFGATLSASDVATIYRSPTCGD